MKYKIGDIVEAKRLLPMKMAWGEVLPLVELNKTYEITYVFDNSLGIKGLHSVQNINNFRLIQRGNIKVL